MRRYRLFCEALLDGMVSLSPEESHHALAALRLKCGHEVVLFDGAGREGVGVIVRIGGPGGRANRHPQLHVQVPKVIRRPFELIHRITLAVAVTKPHRQAYLVEKCTELGVAAIWPIVTERSVARPGEGVIEKLSRRVIEAAKQSGRAWIPKIAMSQTFSKAIARVGEFDAASLTHPDPSLTPFNDFLAGQQENASVLVFVGSEGGWSEVEREEAVAAGAVPTTLGPTVLRTETAAVAICAAAAMYSARKHGGAKHRVGRDPYGNRTA